MTTEVWVDSESGTAVYNETETATEMVMSALTEQHPEIASMVRWGSQIRRGGIFERDRYVTPTKLYEQMAVAQDAADSDDVVAGVIDATEALAFNHMSIQCDDEDEENIWNQIIESFDLETRMREMWRELSIVSNFYVANWWGNESFKVTGRTKEGVRRKKEFRNLNSISSLSLLDPLKVVPVGDFMFNREQLAWVADADEGRQITALLENKSDNTSVESRLLVSKYTPTLQEEKRLSALGVPTRNLFLLNPELTWRHTATRPQYKPIAEVRMRSVFELLDLKHLLREMDRAHLLGATNFIVLVKRGTDDKPAKQEEINQLQGQIRALSRVPVIVGDHRLSIEIITPSTEYVLQPEKYNAIDARITARLYQIFMSGNFSAGTKGDDSLKLIRIVARGLESRRALLKKAVERKVLRPIWEANEQLVQIPTLVFHPKQISLDFDPGLAAFFMDLRDRREISRATLLEQIDLDQDEESRRRERESDHYDDTFNSLTPLNDPKLQMKDQKADPKSAGRSGGGNRNGGGSAPGSGQGMPEDPRRKAGD